MATFLERAVISSHCLSLAHSNQACILPFLCIFFFKVTNEFLLGKVDGQLLALILLYISTEFDLIILSWNISLFLHHPRFFCSYFSSFLFFLCFSFCFSSTLFLFYILIFFFFKKLIIFWLHWVIVAACGLSLVAASRSYSSLQCAGLSLWWLLLLLSTGPRAHGLQ